MALQWVGVGLGRVGRGARDITQGRARNQTAQAFKSKHETPKPPLGAHTGVILDPAARIEFLGPLRRAGFRLRSFVLALLI